MVEQILDFSRLQSGEVRITVDRHVVGALISVALEELQMALVDHEVRLDLEPALAVIADRDAAVVVLRNLLGNATKFSPAGTTIRIKAWVEGAEEILSVGDQGPGIPAEDREHIFDRFWQGAVQIAGHRGTGVGLSIVRRYVELQGGRTWVVPALGPGATIAFTLPLARR